MNMDLERKGPVHCALHNDPRLIPGVAAIAEHVAQRAGLSERAQGNVAAAAVEACCDMFLLARGNTSAEPVIQISAADFPDRVEVTLEFSAAPMPAANSRSSHPEVSATAVDNIRKTLEGVLVDRVGWESLADGRARLTLIKYSAVAKSQPNA